MSESFTDNDQLLESDQDFLNQKKRSYNHRKIILFIFQHLDLLTNTPPFKRVFSNRNKLLDFLAKEFKPFSTDYQTHAHLIDRLASKSKTSYNQIVDQIILSIKSKTTKTSLDYQFMALFDAKDRKALLDPDQEKLLYTMAQKTDASPDYMKIKSFHLFFRVFQYFKNKKIR